MEWDPEKIQFLANVERVLTQLGKDRPWLNRQIYGELPTGKPKNDLFRSDQKKIKFKDALHAAEALNRSVEELMTEISPESPKSGPESPKVAEPIPKYKKPLSFETETDLGHAVNQLSRILSSGNHIIIRAILSNLEAFSFAVDYQAQAEARIEALEKKCDDLEKKATDLENTIEALKEKIQQRPKTSEAA